MQVKPSMRRQSFFILSATIVVVFVLFGVPVDYAPGTYFAIVFAQVFVICSSAWVLGVSAIKADAVESRMTAISGALLITPWVLVSFLAGIGPPGNQTSAENELRYLVLLISAMAVGGGLIVLKETLSKAGENFFSTLGFAAILIATPMYLVWASLMLQDFRGLALSTADSASHWIRWIRDLTDILLFFGGVLSYVAAAMFAMALGKVQWLGRRSIQVCVAASIVALLCLTFRGFRFPIPATLQWYEFPGFVFGIPAIPWIIPCIFGITILRRAGSNHGQ